MFHPRAPGSSPHATHGTLAPPKKAKKSKGLSAWQKLKKATPHLLSELGAETMQAIHHTAKELGVKPAVAEKFVAGLTRLTPDALENVVGAAVKVVKGIEPLEVLENTLKTLPSELQKAADALGLPDLGLVDWPDHEGGCREWALQPHVDVAAGNKVVGQLSTFRLKRRDTGEVTYLVYGGAGAGFVGGSVDQRPSSPGKNKPVAQGGKAKKDKTRKSFEVHDAAEAEWGEFKTKTRLLFSDFDDTVGRVNVLKGGTGKQGKKLEKVGLSVGQVGWVFVTLSFPNLPVKRGKAGDVCRLAKYVCPPAAAGDYDVKCSFRSSTDEVTAVSTGGVFSISEDVEDDLADAAELGDDVSNPGDH